MRYFMNAILIMLLAAAACGVCRAQGGDIRITPLLKSYTLPASARMQSAARIGSRTLAVWGTTEFAPDSSRMTVLTMQPLHNSAVAGPLTKVHGEDAHPCDVVGVCASDRFFLVLWNDCRADEPAIYGRYVDTAGRFLGDEIHMSGGKIINGECWIIGTGSQGFMLIWRDARKDRPGYYAQTLSAPENQAGTDTYLGTRIEQIVSHPERPGYYIIRCDSGRTFLHHDGRLDAISPNITSGENMVMGRDGAVAWIEGENLVVYRSILDLGDGPMRVVPLPWIGSAAGRKAALALDSAENYRVFYADVKIAGSHDSVGSMVIHVFRIDVSAEGSVTPPWMVRVFSEKRGAIDPGSSAPYILSRLQDIEIRRGSNNTSQLNILILDDYYARRQSYRSEISTISFGIGEYGGYLGDQNFYYWLTTPKVDAVARRIDSGAYSAIRVVAANDSIVLLAPAAFVWVAGQYENPVILLRDGQAIVAWNEVSCGLLENDVLRSLPNKFRYNVLDRFQGYDEFHTIEPLAGTGWRSSMPHIHDIPGNKFLDFLETRSDQVAYRRTYTTETGTYYSQRIGVAIPTASGIIEALSLMQSIYQPANLPYPYPSYNLSYHPVDPNSGDMPVFDRTGMIGVGTGQSLYGINVSTGKFWKMDHPRALAYDSHVIPVGSAEYISITKNNAVHIRGTDSINGFFLDSVPPTVVYQRLYGRHFLRYYPLDSTGKEYNYEIFDLTGRSVGKRRFDFDGMGDGFSIIQDPSSRNLVALWGSTTGVHAMLLDTALRIVVGDTIISQTRAEVGRATGIIRNGMLTAIWGEQDQQIYSTQWRVPHGLSSVEGGDRGEDDHAGTAGAIMHIRPIPAAITISIDIDLPGKGIAALDVVDAFGRRVYHEEREFRLDGGATWNVNVTELPSGIYSVVLRNAAGIMAVKRMVVMH